MNDGAWIAVVAAAVWVVLGTVTWVSDKGPTPGFALVSAGMFPFVAGGVLMWAGILT